MFGNPFSCLPNITSKLEVVGLYLHACSCYNEQAIDNMRFPMLAGRGKLVKEGYVSESK